MSKKRVLHLMPDEKITSQLIDNFNLLDIENYFLIHKGCSLELDNNNLEYSISEFKINNFIEQYSIEGIIIHGLNGVFAKYVCDLIGSLKIAWIEWGFDVYNRPHVRKNLYGTETLKIYPQIFNIKNKIKRHPFIRNLYFSISKKDNYESYFDRSYKKIDYFCTYIYEDYIFFNKHYEHNTSYLYTPFSTLKQYLGGQKSIRINDNAENILIGNSNSIENNHLDIFKMLKHGHPISNLKIIVPLSYGNNQIYKKIVVENGNKYFGENFIPLLDFVPRDEYFNLLTGCSTAVFYHYRQQAMGNIIALLYMGVRVYLSDKNPVYTYCKRVGVHIYNFDTEFNTYKNSILEESKVVENRRILYNIFNQEEVIDRLDRLVKKL